MKLDHLLVIYQASLRLLKRSIYYQVYKHAIDGALQYASTITCLLMVSIWYKILVAIDNVNMTIESLELQHRG